MPVVEEVCRITTKGQTTIPKSVRQALGVGYGGRIAFRVEGDVVTVRAAEDESDPALAPFLDLLACDIAARPHELKALTPELAARLTTLTKGVAVDLDAPIEGETSL